MELKTSLIINFVSQQISFWDDIIPLVFKFQDKVPNQLLTKATVDCQLLYIPTFMLLVVKQDSSSFLLIYYTTSIIPNDQSKRNTMTVGIFTLHILSTTL